MTLTVHIHLVPRLRISQVYRHSSVVLMVLFLVINFTYMTI